MRGAAIISSAAIRMTARCRWTTSCGWQEEGRTFVIDTGFNAEVAKKRKRTFLRCPVETLGAFGIDVNAVEDVILTHLHYDHAGNFDRFPNARFHLQERELAYATGVSCAIRGYRTPSR
jgi:glyoxylase-like metal-dependent hydrolase (beta-lactamase superfamily II)